jgi:hypothetical protein
MNPVVAVSEVTLLMLATMKQSSTAQQEPSRMASDKDMEVAPCALGGGVRRQQTFERAKALCTVLYSTVQQEVVTFLRVEAGNL